MSAVSTGRPGGPLSHLADTTEGAQLDASVELLEHAQGVLADEDSEMEELRLLATDLTGAVGDALRVAVSRGHRLSMPDTYVHEGDNGIPRLPAAAFG